MFILFSSQQDDCAARVYGEIRARGREALLVDDGLSTSCIGFNWRADSVDGADGWFSVGDRRVDLHEIDGILLRMVNPLQGVPGQLPHDQHYVLIELIAAIEGLANAFPGPVVNRPVPGLAGRHVYARRGGSAAVAESGFCIPDMRISSEPAQLCAHFAAQDYSSVRVAGLHAPIAPSVMLPDRLPDAVARIAGNGPLPSIYVQGLPAGEFAQVFVVGDQTFPVAADASAQHGAHRLLGGVETCAQSARTLVRELGMSFAVVNVLVDDEGSGYCLDVDEFPIYNHCSEEIKAQITSALVDTLSAPAEVAA